MNCTYLKFEKICRNGSYNEIEDFLVTNEIDINYDDDFYVDLLAERGDISLLKLIKKYNGNLHDEEESVMHILALRGFIDCLEYVIDDCENDNWRMLLKTNAYNNNKKTKMFIDQKMSV